MILSEEEKYWKKYKEDLVKILRVFDSPAEKLEDWGVMLDIITDRPMGFSEVEKETSREIIEKDYVWEVWDGDYWIADFFKGERWL